MNAIGAPPLSVDAEPEFKVIDAPGFVVLRISTVLGFTEI